MLKLLIVCGMVLLSFSAQSGQEDQHAEPFEINQQMKNYFFKQEARMCHIELFEPLENNPSGSAMFFIMKHDLARMLSALSAETHRLFDFDINDFQPAGQTGFMTVKALHDYCYQAEQAYLTLSKQEM